MRELDTADYFYDRRNIIDIYGAALNKHHHAPDYNHDGCYVDVEFEFDDDTASGVLSFFHCGDWVFQHGDRNSGVPEHLNPGPTGAGSDRR